MLDDTCYLEQGEDGFAGAKYVMSPPLRHAGDRAALRERLWPARSIRLRPTTVALTCTGKRTAGATTSARFPTADPAWSIVPSRSLRALRDSWSRGSVPLMSENPARVFGMYPHKAVLPRAPMPTCACGIQGALDD